MPRGELIDRIQNIAGNVADRQYLNSRRLRPCIIPSSAPITFCLQIRLSPRFPATSPRSVVVVLLLFIYLVCLSFLSPGTTRRSVEKSLTKVQLAKSNQCYMHYNFSRIHQTLLLTPAMEAGISDDVGDLDEIIGLLVPDGI